MADKKKHALSTPKYRLSAPTPNVKGKYASLQWDIWNNNPRAIVNTNDPAMVQRQYGRITAALDGPTFFAFLELLKKVIDNKEPSKYKIENFGKAKGAEQFAPPVHQTDLGVGRDAEGAVYMYVASKEEGWPLIKFMFGPADGRFHKVFADGTPLTKAETSDLYARSYCTLLSNIMANVLDTHYEDPPPFNPGNKGGGGGYGGGNRGGNQGGGQQRQAAPANADFDDDIPF